MALSDLAAELTGDIPWRTCAVCHHLDTQSPEWAGLMRRLLADRSVQFVDLATKLAADPDEPSIPRDALSRHARGLCSAREVLR